MTIPLLEGDGLFLKQANGKRIRLLDLHKGDSLIVKTIHHSYRVIILDAKSGEMVLWGNEEGHRVPRVYKFSYSFFGDDNNGFVIEPEVLREGFQLEFTNLKQGTVLHISYVENIDLKDSSFLNRIFVKSFEPGFLGRCCKFLVSILSHPRWVAFVYKKSRPKSRFFVSGKINYFPINNIT